MGSDRKEYRFETDGTVSLADLFQGRSQLLVYHFMFGRYTAAVLLLHDSGRLQRIRVHLANHDVMLSASRGCRSRSCRRTTTDGWTFPWHLRRRDFNFDFNVSFTRTTTRRTSITLPARRHAMDMTPARTGRPVRAMCGTDAPTYTRDRPGMSAFVLEDVSSTTLFHLCAGLDGLWAPINGSTVPHGRNETGIWWRRRDAYDKADPVARAGTIRNELRLRRQCLTRSVRTAAESGASPPVLRARRRFIAEQKT